MQVDRLRSLTIFMELSTGGMVEFAPLLVLTENQEATLMQSLRDGTRGLCSFLIQRGNRQVAEMFGILIHRVETPLHSSPLPTHEDSGAAGEGGEGGALEAEPPSQPSREERNR